jgi:hypothetical protein
MSEPDHTVYEANLPCIVNGAGVKQLRARTIVRAISDAAERWRNADFPARVRATRAIETRMSYTEPVIDYALDALFCSIDAPAIEAVIVNELGSIGALDDFMARAGRPDVTYVARDPIAIVASDTTIGVAIPALVFALCAKATIRVKDRDDGLTRAFVETLGEELPDVRDAVAIDVWSGADDATAQRFFHDVGAAVAFGRDDALRAIRARLPVEAAFVGFGHRTSIAYVARESLADEQHARAAARAIARDVMLYDGDGCLSPHAIFCERGGAVDPRAFARTLGDACDEAAIEFPASESAFDPDAARYRDAARFRAAQGEGAVFGGTIAPHLIVLDPPRGALPPLLPRTAAVYAIEGPSDVMRFIASHALPLEGVAVSQPRADLDAFVRASGASRMCALGTLQRPPLGGDHGGAGRILPLVRAIYRA